MSSTTTLAGDVVANFGLEIGIFAGISILMTFFILRRIKGDFKNLDTFFASKPWPFLSSDRKLVRYTKTLKIITYVLLIVPYVALSLWGGIMISVSSTSSYSTLSGVSVLLLGFAIVLFSIAVLYIKWSFFKIRLISIIAMVVAFLLYTAFQLYAVFEQSPASYTGLSAVFLTLNSLVMVLLTFLSYSKSKGSILDILEMTQNPNANKAISTKYNDLDLQTQQEKLLNDSEYIVTDKEILDHLSIVKDKQDFKKSILAGGIQTFFKNKNKVARNLSLVTIYGIAVAILIIYGYLCKKYCSEANLGWLTAVAVYTTDLIIYFMSQLDMNDGPLTLSLTIVGMRCFLFGFGSSYWFIGYCALYLLLTSILGWKAISSTLPLQLWKKKKNPLKIHILKRIYKSYGFVYFFANLVFAIIIIIVSKVTIDVPSSKVTIYGNEYDFWVFGVASILISLTLQSLFVTFRFHQRMEKGIQDKMQFCKSKKAYPTFIVTVIFAYAFAIVVGALWYSVVENLFILLTAIIIPLVLLFGYIFWINFRENDYQILADIKILNAKTQKILDNKKKEEDKLKKVQESARSPDLQNVILESKRDFAYEYLSFGLQSKELKIHEDWRGQIGFFKAFFGKKLLKTDYYNIFSVFFCACALIIYSIVIFETSTTVKLSGFTVSVTLSDVGLILIPLAGYFGTDKRPNLMQIILYLLGIGGNYGYGIAVLLYQYDAVKGDEGAMAITIYFFFGIPLAICSLGAYEEIKANKKTTRLSIAFIALILIHIIAMAIFFLALDWTASGIVVFGVLVIILCGLVLLHIYRKNNNSLPRKVLTTVGAVGGLVVLAIFIVSLILDSFNAFVGFSLSYMTYILIQAFLLIRRVIADFINKSKSPVFYSPWIFPIYKFDPKIGNLRAYNDQGINTILIIFGTWLWSIMLVIWVSPTYIGVSIGCLVEVLAAVWFVFLTTYSTDELSVALSREDLFDKCVKRAWIEVRTKYLQSKNVLKIADVVTFAEQEAEKQKILSFIEATKKNFGKAGRVGPTSNDSTPKDTRDLHELYQQLNSVDLNIEHAFKDEVRLLIHLELTLMTSINQIINEEKLRLIMFVQQKSANLIQEGIPYFIFGPEKLSTDAKFKLIMDRYEKLNEDEIKKFDKMKNEFLAELKKIDEKAQDRSNNENEAGKKRQQELARKLDEKKKTLQGDLTNVPINQMPDSIQKYHKISKEFDQNKKFSDDKFPANESVLGENIAPLVSGWKRASDANLTLMGDGFSALDPRQGSIGDCYLISSLSIAGKKFIEGALIIAENKDSKNGSYIIRYYFEGEPVEIIVDDQFPVDSNGDWVLCKSDGGKALWPMLLEKAYAKMHGGYDKIVAGKVSYALSEITDGYPEEIKLTTAQQNVDVFWQTLSNYVKQGYLIGAGTPENPMGDAAVSDTGVIQGHAYAVMKIQEFENEKLIQLRNPHGKGGAEWNGDWSDGSTKWTEKAKRVLAFEESEDGVFWMSVNDFVFEFKTLYVCRIFDEKIWKTTPAPIEGEWRGETAAGLPSKKNPSADMSKNPHYSLKVNKRCVAFISLTQLDRKDMFRGNKPIMFMVQKNDGKRIKTASLDLLAGSSGAPTDLLTVSAQINLDAPSYPYTFSLMVASAFAGADGEGKYNLSVYCTDSFTLNQM